MAALQLAFLLVIASSSFETSSCLRYIVGGTLWSIPPYPDFYTNWSFNNVFYIGDSIVFEFDSEFFNVIQVPKLDYQSCSTANPIKILTASPAIVTLNEEGEFYYLCNISRYCELGQKFSLLVRRQNYSPSLSPSPSPLAPLSLAPTWYPNGGGTNDTPSQSPAPTNTIMVPAQISSGNNNVVGPLINRMSYGGILILGSWLVSLWQFFGCSL